MKSSNPSVSLLYSIIQDNDLETIYDDRWSNGLLYKYYWTNKFVLFTKRIVDFKVSGFVKLWIHMTKEFVDE